MLVVMLAGCGSDNASQDNSDSQSTSDSADNKSGKTLFKVAYSCGQTFEERWQKEVAMFEEFFGEKNVDFQYQIANNDNNKQVSQCENFISQGIDVLIITPADADAASVIVDSCKEDGVPVVVYDQPLNSPNVDYLVTFDAVETGELEAHCAFDNAPEGNYVLLYGDAANVNAQNIKIGFWNVIGDAVEAGDINVVLEQWVTAWDPTQALEFTENALTTQDNDIAGICAANDGIAGGAIEALTAQGLGGKVFIGGQDADLAACQRVVEGTQYGTVYKNLQKLNKATCQLVWAILNGEEDPMSQVDSDIASATEFTLEDGTKLPFLKIEQVLVTKENMKEEICDTGFHTMEEVYANIPESEWPQ